MSVTLDKTRVTLDKSEDTLAREIMSEAAIKFYDNNTNRHQVDLAEFVSVYLNENVSLTAAWTRSRARKNQRAAAERVARVAGKIGL